MARAWASCPLTIRTDSHSWATALASRVPVPARAVDGSLTLGPANQARARALADAWEDEGDHQYPCAPA